MAIQILMPALSPTMTEGNLANWLKKEGDSVESGDIIAEIETDKATMEVEAVDEGIIGKILVEAGTEGVAVNQPIAILLEEGEDESAMEGLDKAPDVSGGGGGELPKSEAKSENAPKDDAPASDAPKAAPAAGDGKRVFSSPLARRIAKQNNLDIAKVKGSGPRGRVVKSDVEAALKSGTGVAADGPAKAEKSAAPASAPKAGSGLAQVPANAKFHQVPNTNMRKVIARRLSESKATVPHWYLTVEIELDALMALRAELNSRAKDGDYKISVNDMIIKASALALRKVPECNTTWDEEGIVFYDDVDVSVAVSTPAGLITPIVRNADHKGLVQISKEMKDLGKRAKDNALKPEEFQGGGFSISNLGMFGVKEFAPIVNPPQTAILGVSAGEQRAVVKNGALAIATTMNCTLSADHRVVDGVVSATFMQALKGYLEDPVTMML